MIVDLTQKVKEVQRVQYCLVEWADNPLTFKQEPPSWLQTAILTGQVIPQFRTEDYWYLVVKTDDGFRVVSPGDWIVMGNNGLFVEAEQTVLCAQ